jgi:hypothetical protein
VSTPTVHQRAHLWLWHHRDGPGWCRNPESAEWKALWDAGARVIRVQLQDDWPVPRSLVDGWRDVGRVTGRPWKVWGAIRPSHEPLGGDIWTPMQTADFAASEKRLLSLQGMDFNFEREVRDEDTASGGWWSGEFVSVFRRLWPNLPCALDTVFGDFAGGINNVYTPAPAGMRMNVQTYWGPEGIYDDPVPNIVKWCAGASPSIPKSVIKPVFRVTRNNSGELLDPALAIADCVKAGTVGLVLYYVDGADVSYLCSFIRDAIAAGAAR